MTEKTSNKIGNFKFLKFRCGFFSMEYRSNNTYEMVENMKRKSNVGNTNGKIIRKNIKCEIGKNAKLQRKLDRKIVNRNMKLDSRKSNGNSIYEKNVMKIDIVKNGLEILERIARIGSALSGLLPSTRYTLLKRVAAVV